MRPARARLVILILASSGLGSWACLPEDPPVEGRLLRAGVGLLRPEFRYLDQEPWVQFEVRQSRADGERAARSSVHLVNWRDPGQHRVLLESRSHRTGWPRLQDASGALFYMTDEQLAAGMAPAATLVRLSLTAGVVETIPDVTGYVPLLDDDHRVLRFQYRKRLPGSSVPELHVRDLTGLDRNLGLATGPAQFVGQDRLYYVAGPERSFGRLVGLDGEPQVFRHQVSSFLLHGSERLAILSVSDRGTDHTLVFDLDSGQERPLPVERPGKILGLRGDVLIYSQPPADGRTAELHLFDIVTSVLQRYVLPPEISDVATLVTRDPDWLLYDSQGRLTIFRRNSGASFETTALQPAAPSFSPDGRFLIYIAPQATNLPGATSRYRGGELRVQSTADWQEGSRLLSPFGTSVSLQPAGFGLRPDADFPMFFWARYGLGGSDLYIANHETGAVMKVAKGIGAVAIGERHLLGVLRLGQDRTGDLIYRELLGSREKVIEHGVAEMTIASFEDLGELVAFVVRERMDASPRNGLWATTLPPLASQGAATAARRVRPWTILDGAEERMGETEADHPEP